MRRIGYALCVLALLSGTVLGTGIWQGTADSYWTNSANWDDGKVPGYATNVTFPNAANQIVIVTRTQQCGSITFNASNAYQIQQGTLAPLSSMRQDGTGTVWIGSDMIIQDGFAMSGSGEGTVTAAGSIRGGIMQVNVSNHVVELAGTNTYRRASGDYSTVLYRGTLRVTGENIQTMSAASLRQYAAATVIVASASSTPLGKGTWLLESGASLTIATGDTNGITLGNPLYYNADSTLVRIAGPGPIRFTNTVTVAGASSIGCAMYTETGPAILASTLTASGLAQFWKRGTNRLTIAADGRITAGKFYVPEGELIVNGLASVGSASYLQIYSMAAGVTLGGSGVVHYTCSLPAGVTLSPGDPVGTLTMSNLTMQANSVYDWDFERGAYDGCAASNLVLGSPLRLRLRERGGYIRTNDAFVLFSYAEANPSNPTWQFEFVGNRWTRTNAVVSVNTNLHEVLLTGIEIRRPGTMLIIL